MKVRDLEQEVAAKSAQIAELEEKIRKQNELNQVMKEKVKEIAEASAKLKSSSRSSLNDL